MMDDDGSILLSALETVTLLQSYGLDLFDYTQMSKITLTLLWK